MVEQIGTNMRRIALIWAVLAAVMLVWGGLARAASGGTVVPSSMSTSGLSVALANAGHVQYVFWRGGDGRIYEARYAGKWRGPLKTPWYASSPPSAAISPDGTLFLSWRGTANHIFEASYKRRWSKPTDLTKSGKWRTKGEAISSVSLAVNPRNGDQILMWRGTDGRVHEAWRTKKWHGPLVMPWTARYAPTVSVTRSGHEYVFWNSANGDIEEAWYQGSWHGPADLTQANGWGEFGQTSTRPGIGVNPVDGSQYVFWSAMDGRVYEAWYEKGWHGPVNMGWSATSPLGLAITPGGRQYVFWQGPDGASWETWHDTAWHGPIAPLRHTTGPGTDVAVTQSTANFYERLARLANVRFTGSGTGGLPTIQVDDTQRYQRYTGVGGAMTDSSAWLINDELSPVTRGALMNDLFGPLGAHFNFTVVPMGGSDFTRTGQPYTYDDVPAGQTDPQLTQFSTAHDEPYILPALRQMLAVNPATTVMATPWTAPPWMKANDAYDDRSMAGTLNSSAYQPFADYFVKFLQAYAAAGVPVAAIAPENEPDSGAAFPAMNFTPSGEAQWITQNLEPSLAAANLHPRLYGGDVGWAGAVLPECAGLEPGGEHAQWHRLALLRRDSDGDEQPPRAGAELRPDPCGVLAGDHALPGTRGADRLAAQLVERSHAVELRARPERGAGRAAELRLPRVHRRGHDRRGNAHGELPLGLLPARAGGGVRRAGGGAGGLEQLRQLRPERYGTV